MPAILALVTSAAAPPGRALAALGGGLWRAARRVAQRMKNRRAADRLAALDDRMLADIGLTRSDLRDAYAEPLWHDPTDMLARRAAERRGSGRRPAERSSSETPPWRPPRTDRPVRCLT